MFAIADLSLIPVRKEPSDKSEMVSQLLFGETVEILESKDQWNRVRILYDNYSGWVDSKQIQNISDKQFREINEASPFLSADLFQIVVWNKNRICPIVLGSSLPCYDKNQFYIGSETYRFEGNALEADNPKPERLLDWAYLYLNAPYLWGGRSPLGIDCSGFTQMVFKLSSIKLNRDAWQQSEQGEKVRMIEESQPGDLAFFQNEEGRISHVGIILPKQHIIHASGRVRIDRFDEQGIYNEEKDVYSHRLKMIRRYIN